MSNIINGSEIASRVLGNTGGAAAKMAFKIDTIKFSWVDKYLRDKALRNKIMTLQEKIKEAQASPIHRDELRAMFDSALSTIKKDRLQWFAKMLKLAQNRQDAMVNSNTLLHRAYIPSIGLSETDIADMIMQLPVGVKQVDIDAEVKRCRDEILSTEALIGRALCPPERWIYRDDGKPYPYPQGCRWTQYVTAWEKIAPRYNGPVSVEGSAIESDSEMTAYVALDLGKIAKAYPLRDPGN